MDALDVLGFVWPATAPLGQYTFKVVTVGDHAPEPNPYNDKMCDTFGTTAGTHTARDDRRDVFTSTGFSASGIGDTVVAGLDTDDLRPKERFV